MLKIKNLLEGTGYSGWADCDLKYDKRDGKIKIFEINIRQGDLKLKRRWYLFLRDVNQYRKYKKYYHIGDK